MELWPEYPQGAQKGCPAEEDRYLVLGFVSFVWLNKTNKMNKTNQIDQMNKTGWRTLSTAC
jgi:hypothetical protein